MIRDMRTLAGRISCAIATAWLSPLAAWAAEDEVVNARLEGYATNIKLEPGSSALTYLLFFFLSAIAAAVVFKNARRTHLD